MSAQNRLTYVQVPTRLLLLPSDERTSAIEVWTVIHFHFRVINKPFRLTDTAMLQTPYLKGRSRRFVTKGLDVLEAQGLIKRETQGCARLITKLAVLSGPHPLPTLARGYRNYLASDEWLEKRRAAHERAGHRCQVCNSDSGDFDVHHRTYERVGKELPEDLLVLCRECHKLFHESGQLRAPIQKEVG
jgi:hypothetical protein